MADMTSARRSVPRMPAARQLAKRVWRH